jgi:hypothetical protein
LKSNELTTALQIGLHNAPHFLRRTFFTLKRDDCDGQLTHADTGDVNPELSVNRPSNDEHQPRQDET